MLLETIAYIYGARFITYLSIKYGVNDVIKWIRAEEHESYIGFIGKFEDVFKKDFDEAWEEFIRAENDFQQSNINLISQNELTKIRKVSEETFGWVSQPIYDEYTNEILFAYHRPHELAKSQ